MLREPKKQNGFTLIELLVVISIIGLLASVVLIAVNSARAKARDTRRIADITQIQKALEIYISNHGTLPDPGTYGRSNVSPGWWDGWWDLSSSNAGAGFLNFLVTDGIISKTPADPLNTPLGANAYPGDTGYRYFYFNVPASYIYQGGNCQTNVGLGVYMIGISKLETDNSRPPTKFQGSGCGCLWNNSQNFFQPSLDYIVCGKY